MLDRLENRRNGFTWRQYGCVDDQMLPIPGLILPVYDVLPARLAQAGNVWRASLSPTAMLGGITADDLYLHEIRDVRGGYPAPRVPGHRERIDTLDDDTMAETELIGGNVVTDAVALRPGHHAIPADCLLNAVDTHVGMACTADQAAGYRGLTGRGESANYHKNGHSPIVRGLLVPDGFVLDPGAGRPLQEGGMTMKVGADRSGRWSVFETTVSPGFDVGAHLHRDAEEVFYILEGELDLLAFEPRSRAGADWATWESADGASAVRGGPGSLMFVPPGCPHAFANRGVVPARMLFVVGPPGHEDYLAELGTLIGRKGPPDQDAIAALRARWDIEQLTPMHPGPRLPPSAESLVPRGRRYRCLALALDLAEEVLVGRGVAGLVQQEFEGRLRVESCQGAAELGDRGMLVRGHHDVIAPGA